MLRERAKSYSPAQIVAKPSPWFMTRYLAQELPSASFDFVTVNRRQSCPILEIPRNQRNAKSLSQCIRTQAHRLHELRPENPARDDLSRRDVKLASQFGSGAAPASCHCVCTTLTVSSTRSESIYPTAARFSIIRFFISALSRTTCGGCPLPVNTIFDQ